MTDPRLKELEQSLIELSSQLQGAFRPDTAAPGFHGNTPSTGQCAATAVVLNSLLGGEMVSTKIQGLSHWFNRLAVGPGEVDVDLTGDQFGFPRIQIKRAGELYTDTRVRQANEVNDETLRRARRLAGRLGVRDVERALELALTSRGATA